MPVVDELIPASRNGSGGPPNGETYYQLHDAISPPAGLPRLVRVHGLHGDRSAASLIQNRHVHRPRGRAGRECRRPTPRSVSRSTMIDRRRPGWRCLRVDGVQGDLVNVEAADHAGLASLLLGGEDEPVVAGVAGVAAGEGVEVLEGALAHQGHLSA
jgi:hypothetical protein